jgi:hypothetical protein
MQRYGFINDASKEVCGARGVTVVRPAKAGLSFRPELHGGADVAACTHSGHDNTPSSSRPRPSASQMRLVAAGPGTDRAKMP